MLQSIAVFLFLFFFYVGLMEVAEAIIRKLMYGRWLKRNLKVRDGNR